MKSEAKTSAADYHLNTHSSNKTHIQLIKTRLCAPPPPSRIVHRPRLVTRLNEGLQHKLPLLSAPAGFGKTVLLSEWIADIKQPVAWLSLDDGNNDPSLFGAYLIAALRTKEANFGQAAMAAFQSRSYTSSIESILSALINELQEKKAEVVLILDDYHKITSQAINNAVTFLIDHMPPKIHLFIAGRADPPLHLAHLRTLGQLTELRAADMRFTTDETAAFFNNVMNLGLSQEDIATLEARTEGWVAGLEMAALAMRDREDIANFIAKFSGSNRYIVDYLTEEVLQRQEKDTQSFLLKTAILGRMAGPLCDALTGRSDGQEMLEYLEANNLFIMPLDDERFWYRYYPLFSEALRNKLNRSTPSLVATLHRRASEWFEQRGLMDEAVHHALAAEDFEHAAGLIETMSEEILMQGRITTLFGLLRQLPNEVITRRPRFCLHCAWAYLMAGQENNIEPLLKAAEKGLSNETDADQKLLKGHMLGIRGYIAKLQGDIPSAIKNCEAALKVLPENEPVVRPVVFGNIGHAYFEKGDMAGAKKYMEQSCKNGRAVGNIFTALAAKGFLSYILIEQGQLQEAAKVCQQTIQLGLELSGRYPLPAAGHAYIGLGQVLYERNNLKSAAEQLTKGIELGETGQFWVVVIKGYLVLAQLEQAMGDEDAAMQAVAMAEATAPKILMARESSHISSWKTRLALARGDLPAAVHWADSQEHKLSLRDVPDYRLEPLYLTLLRVKIAQGQVDKEIPGLLEHFRQKVEAKGRIRTVIEILTLQALAFAILDETERAIATLEQALLLAEPECYVRLFLDCGPPIQKLLRQAATRVSARQYVAKLLKAFQLVGSVTLLSSCQTETPLLDVLNEREMAILRLKGTHSDREIADELFLSVNTVKWYAHRIYNKLGVNNRAEAITRAYDLNIL